MLPGTTDEALAGQARQGDREAFLILYNRYLNKVYNRVKTRIPERDAEDVVQEIFIAVVRSLNGFEARSQFNTWLYTIVNRQIVDYYRKHGRTMQNEEQEIAIDDMERHLRTDTGEHDAIDLRAQVQKALAKLPEHYQEIILQRFSDDLTFQEIAQRRNQTLEAVKSLYRRALQAVRNEVGDLA